MNEALAARRPKPIAGDRAALGDESAALCQGAPRITMTTPDHSTFSFTSDDGTALSVHRWLPDGSPKAEANPNGSLSQVAGVTNRRGNVFGLMPHPEHAVEAAIGGLDGRVILESLLDAVKGGTL